MTVRIDPHRLRAKASIASLPTNRDDRETPLMRAGRQRLKHCFVFSEIGMACGRLTRRAEKDTLPYAGIAKRLITANTTADLHSGQSQICCSIEAVANASCCDIASLSLSIDLDMDRVAGAQTRTGD